MSDAAELVRLIKKAAVDAVSAGKPAAVCFGRVASTVPLKISVDQRLVLEEEQLILTKAVTDHWVDITAAFNTEEQEGAVGEGSHFHRCKGKKKILLLNGLSEGEEVILLRAEGGQRFIVLDRLSNKAVEGEWTE